jgi:hypothetical protein
MKIIDENGIELENPDFSLGYLKEEVQTIHHEAVEGVKEKFHYETIREYPNGGKDVRKVIDVPGVEAKEAWYEKVAVHRYVRYTEEELAVIRERNKSPYEERIKELEEALELLLSGVTE